MDWRGVCDGLIVHVIYLAMYLLDLGYGMRPWQERARVFLVFASSLLAFVCRV